MIDCNTRRRWYEKLARQDFHDWYWMGYKLLPSNPLKEEMNPEIQNHYWRDKRTGKGGKVETCLRCGARRNVRWTC